MQKDNIGFSTRKIKNIKSKEKKRKKRKIFSIIVIIFLLFMLILGVSSYILIKIIAKRAEQNIEERLKGADTKGWQNEWQKITKEMEEEIKNPKDLEEKRGKESEVLSDGKVSVVLNLISRKEEIEEEKAKDGYEFVILDLSVRNQTYEEIMFYNSNFILRDSRYTEYNIKTIESEGVNLLKGMQNIPAREEIEGSIIYEVQKDAGSLEFLYIGEKKLVFEIY